MFMSVVFNVQALFGMCGAWLVCFLLTYFNALPSSPNEYGYMARTDINLNAVKSAAWFYVPYPGELPSTSYKRYNEQGLFKKYLK